MLAGYLQFETSNASGKHSTLNIYKYYIDGIDDMNEGRLM